MPKTFQTDWHTGQKWLLRWPTRMRSYGRSAHRAGIPGALINPEVVLEFPAAVDPVDARPVVQDSFVQHLTDCTQ